MNHKKDFDTYLTFLFQDPQPTDFKAQDVSAPKSLAWVLSGSSCLTLCYPMDCSPLGSSVHGILQARILEFVAISYSRGSSRPRDQIQVSCISCIAGRFCTTEPPGKTLKKPYDPPFSPHWSLSKSCSLPLLGSIPTDLLPSPAEGFS